MVLSGRDFELIVKPFFKSLFERVGFKIFEIRNQNSGTQNGFDIKVEFEDLNNKRRNIFIECKYYSTTLEWKEIVIKQMQLWGANYEADGFIALSPKENLSNIDDNIQAKIEKHQIFGFPSDFWTPDKGIEEIFSLDKDIYQKVFGKPLTASVDESQVITKVRGHIEKLLNKKDLILKSLPIKNHYSAPEHYMSRKVVSLEAQHDDLGFLAVGETILETFQKESKIALLGWAGTGKSVELKYLASELSASTNHYFPFLITLNNHVDKHLTEYIPNISKIPESSIVLLLDGLDEVQARDFENTRRRINKFSQDFPAARVIVSCRSNFYSTVSANGNLSTLSGFKSFSLSNLSWKNIDDFLSKNLLLKKTSFLEEVQSKNLNDLLYYPFYFRRLVDQYTRHNQISNSKSDFFESVIADDIKEDVAKYFPLERDTKLIESRKLLERLAFILEYQGKNMCAWKELMAAFKPHELDILKRLGRTLYGEEGQESIWKFNHNNTQEFLTAKFISALQPEEVRKIITFPKSHTKVKPTWANTLSLLFSILPVTNQTRIKLTGWIADREPELFIRFEPERVDESTRLQVLKSILGYYKKQGTRINHTKFNISELARFIKSDKGIDLLIQELDLSNSHVARTNALELISHFDIEKLFKSKRALVANILKRSLFDAAEIKYLAMKAYTMSLKLSDEEFDQLFNAFKDESDTYLRYALFSSIHHQNRQDKYVKYAIEQISKLMRSEFENNDGRLSNEYSELRDCLSKITSLEAIEYSVEFVSQNYWSLSYSIYFSEVIHDVLKLAIKESPNERIYQKLKSVVLSENFASIDKNVENLKEYFRETGSYERVFQDVYMEKKTKLDYHSYQVLAILANEKNVEFFANEFLKSEIDKRIVEEFQYYLDRDNRELLSMFNNLVNKKESISLPIYKKHEPIESTISKTKEILFDKGKFMMAIEQVFIDTGKDELSRDDVWGLRREYEKYPPTIHDTIFLRNEGSGLKKAELLKSIEENWEFFSIKKIINLLMDHKTAGLVNSEIQYVKKWCDREIKKINFQKALFRVTPNSIQADKNAVKISFLIRRLKFDHYSKETYLDMLSFQKYGDNEESIVDFVATVVPKSDIDKRIIENLSLGIDFEMVLESHLEYASGHALVDASSSLLKYLKADKYGRYKVLDCYIKLNGNITELENLLPEVKDNFRHKLFEELINQGSKGVLKLVLDAFKNERNKDEKLVLATHLIKLQNIRGLRYYVNYVEKMKTSIGDSSPSNSLYRLKTVWAIPSLLKLYELSYCEDIKQDSFNKLGDISLGALQAICRYNDNYPKCRALIKLYRIYFKARRIFKRRLTEKALSNLQYFIEGQELEYYTRKSLDISLRDAIDRYNLLIRS